MLLLGSFKCMKERVSSLFRILESVKVFSFTNPPLLHVILALVVGINESLSPTQASQRIIKI